MQNYSLEDTEKELGIIKCELYHSEKLKHKKLKKPDPAQYRLTIRNQNISTADYPFLNNLEMSRWNRAKISD